MKRILIFSGIILLVYITATAIINIPQKKTGIEKATFNTPQATGTITPSANLKTEDITIGNGSEARSGQSVTVNYTGTLINGKKFDSSYDRKEPYTFTLGAGEVIKGWDQGVVGMKAGGKRRLTIPPELGYGTSANGSIPANSTLIFEIELLTVNGQKTQSNTQPNLNL
jgi:FKBP-type peptidyl-prolyl cis-trans isomerase